MTILFITRKFPPHVGGMERAAGELYEHLSQIAQVKLIKGGETNRWLPLVLPYFLICCLRTLLTGKIDCVYIQDGLLAPLGLIFRITGKPVAITIHGLDITYKNKVYQFFIPKCVKRLNRVICISEATAQECGDRGIPEQRTTVISWGISDKFFLEGSKQVLREKLETTFSLKLENEKLILSVGRLVKRKGFHWFVEEVIPLLARERQDFKYLIVGDGEFRKELESAINKHNLRDSVILLGNVEEESLKTLYSATDIFVMPNIPVRGDMEGFGLVALEASSCGIPVIASDLEGINKAISHGNNGLLVKPCQASEFASTVSQLLEDDDYREQAGKRGQEFTLRNYGWNTSAQQYLQEFHKITFGN